MDWQKIVNWEKIEEKNPKGYKKIVDWWLNNNLSFHPFEMHSRVLYLL